VVQLYCRNYLAFMIKSKYLQEIIKKINQLNQNKKLEFFIFGSSLTKDHFGDIDLGVRGDIKQEDIIKLKQSLIDSTLPYFVDVINFNKVSQEFKDNVFNNCRILWIKH